VSSFYAAHPDHNLRSEVGLEVNPFLIMLILPDSTHVLIELCATGSILGSLYNLVAASLVLRFKRPPDSSATTAPLPQVSILKPLHGTEPGLYPRLAAFCKQDYPEIVQLICGTQLPDDQAIHAVQLLQKLHSDAKIDLVVDDRSLGSNRKIGNLVNMEAKVRHDVMVLSDSDIVVDDAFLRRAIAELESRRAGAVTCIYYGLGSGGVWARLSAMNINSQFLPNVIIALAFGAATPCFGSAIVLRKATLKRVGGLSAFSDDLADDYAIGRAIRANGQEVVIPRWPIGHACFERSLRAFWDHHMRSARTIRAIDPVGYIGLLFMHPLVLSLLAALAGTAHPLFLIVSAFTARAILNASVEHAFDLDRQSLWLLTMHDVISFAVYACSFLGSAVTWRGSTFHVLRDGTMEKDELVRERQDDQAAL
jgi:ceramide glucosyltransferase